MNRVKHFVEMTGIPLEEARKWVDPLSGLNDAAFGDHVAYLGQKKQYMQRSMAPSSCATPTPEPEKTRAEVVAFMSDFLDEKIDADAQPLSEVEDLGEVADIVRYFADLDEE